MSDRVDSVCPIRSIIADERSPGQSNLTSSPCSVVSHGRCHRPAQMESKRDSDIDRKQTSSRVGGLHHGALHTPRPTAVTGRKQFTFVVAARWQNYRVVVSRGAQKNYRSAAPLSRQSISRCLSRLCGSALDGQA